MNIERYIELWDNRPARLLDIRCCRLPEGSAYKEQPVPSNTFLLVRGCGRLWLNEKLHTAGGWYVLHSAKGANLRAEADSAMELYRIAYLLPEPLLENGPDRKTDTDRSELQCNYGLKPAYPLALLELMEELMETWQETARLERLRVTSVFYQWLYELFKQMLHQQADFSGADRLNKALRYMLENCNEPLTIEHVAAVADCSTRFLNTLFKKRFSASPGQILARLRLERAGGLLLQTEATLQEIGEQVGYANAFTFSRFFKKHSGIAPELYRKEAQAGGHTPDYRIRSLLEEAAAETAVHKERVQERGRNGQEPLGSRKINTPLGEIIVPFKPQRVVVDWSIGEVLALGLTPLGAPHTLLDSNRLLGQYISAGIEDIGNHNLISHEKILELEPDLIITWNRAAYASYSRIAPTIVYEADEFRNVRDGIAEMGRILNRSEQAERWLAEYRRRVSRLRAVMLRQRRDRHTFTVMDPNWSEDIQVVGNTATRGGRAAYGLLGLQPARRVWNELFVQRRDSIWISREDVNKYAGDYTLVLKSEQDMLNTRKLNPSTIDHTGRRKWIELPWEHYFLSDPVSALLQAEEMMRLIAEADV
ncbi:AraC family transcriptional regulator [Paenibacillus camerounensis]|uniref:AraC family transcriptional regulator n=1 Tax=Paenibacillus camerounensis TaxID=1243663 RepID=UPI000694B990|nr:AraC family transcriptional regulator [Paenibacillus camerounensis]